MTFNTRCGDTGKNGEDRLGLGTSPIIIRCKDSRLTPRAILSKFVTVQSKHQLGINEITIYEPEEKEEVSREAVTATDIKPQLMDQDKTLRTNGVTNHDALYKTKSPKGITEIIYEDEDDAYYDDLYFDKSIDGFQMMDINNNEVKIFTENKIDDVKPIGVNIQSPSLDINERVDRVDKKEYFSNHDGLNSQIKIKIQSTFLDRTSNNTANTTAIEQKSRALKAENTEKNKLNNHNTGGSIVSETKKLVN